MHTPFFPQWRARMTRRLPKSLQQLRQQSLLQLESLFAGFVPEGLLAQAQKGANSRERIFTLRRTFFGFLFQVLNPGTACREIVRQVQALFALQGQRPVDEGTGAWCQARARLPLELLARLRLAAAAHAEKAASLWHGLCVKVIDGTTTSLPDTAKNQRAYPQPGSQKPGCGFPLLKLVGVFSLATGVLLDYAKGNKRQHELALLRKLLGQFKAGDLALADRGFSSDWLLALLLGREVHRVFRLHWARPADLRQGRRLGKKDRLVVWQKPPQRPRSLPGSLWKAIPEQLELRVLRYTLPTRGFRSQAVTLVTTLVDPKTYPARELAQLSLRRWRIELWFRDIKTTMGMEVLRCKSPAMVQKELERHFIAYNLIRSLMVKAGAVHRVALEALSFKGAVDALRPFSAALAQARSGKKHKELFARLLEVIALDRLPERPGRREPRAVKRRPKPHPLLNRPRRQFKEVSHRNRYWKSNPRKRRVI
jgi:hypothetical protein